MLKKNPQNVARCTPKAFRTRRLAVSKPCQAFISEREEVKPKPRDLHQRVLDLDPTFDDALLSVSAFNYIVGVIPGFVRAVLWPLGIRSEQRPGIQQLERRRRKGRMQRQTRE
jgi:hypothetical protein